MNKIAIFLCTFFFASTFVQAKSSTMQAVQSDIFYEIARDNKKFVKTWLKSNSDLSIRNQDGQSLLHAAVFSGNRNIVKMLIKAGVHINALDTQGKTALDYAVEFGHEKIVFDLVKKRAHVSNQGNLQQVKSIISAYNKKIMRRFFIMLPIMLVLFIPALMCVIFAMMCGPHATLCLSFFANLFFLGYPPTAIYMLSLPVQASAWTIRSNQVKIFKLVE